jgi:sugar phosphate permease
MIARRVGPKYWLSVLLIVWGALCMAHAGIKNNATLIALRLLLGAAESGYTPIGYYMMSLYYPKYALGLRMGAFSGMYSVAGAFAGLIAYGFLQVTSSYLKGWQILFLFEGGLTVLTGIVALVILPTSLETAWFLTPVERQHAVNRMQRDYISHMDLDPDGNPISQGNDESISMRDITDVLKDWKKLLIILFNILAILPVTAFTTFLPLMVQGMGYSGVKATLMSVPPFVVGTVGLIIIVWSSDRMKERSLHTIFGMALALIGCIVMATSDNPRLRYGFSHVCLAGAFVAGPLIAVWLAGNTPLRVSKIFTIQFYATD